MKVSITHRCLQIRTFVNAKVKWICDPDLDLAVGQELNFKQVHTLKNLIMSQPSKTLPIFKAAPLKSQLKLPTTALKFFLKYPLIFRIFKPRKKLSFPHVRLSSSTIALHNDEELLLNLASYRKDLVERLAKFLMLARSMRVPLYVIDKFMFDLGLPSDYLLTLLPEYPEFFRIVDMGIRGEDGDHIFSLELVSWRENLAVSVMEKQAQSQGIKGRYIRFPSNLPVGFDLDKRVRKWDKEWQNLPYISPYENAFHLGSTSDQAEKWAVAVIHELLWLLLGNKSEIKNLLCLGDYLGFGSRLKEAIVHHPGIFYVSNKIRTATVVLREAYTKNYLIEKHPLMLMRYKYIWRMTAVLRRGIPIRKSVTIHRNKTRAIKGRGSYMEYNYDDDID